MPKLELFGTAGCPHTREMREWLEWKGSEFAEYDVEADPAALRTDAHDRESAVHGPAPGERRQSDPGRLAGPRLRGEREIKFMPNAYSIKVRGVVQGVGFRPFVYRLACANGLKGWVLNAEEGVEIHLEGEQGTLQSFLAEMKARPPQAAAIAEVRVQPAETSGFTEFTIRESTGKRQPTARISPDLPVCEDCLRELFDLAGSPLWLSVSQLHQLRCALQRDTGFALRPAEYHHGRMAAGRFLRRGIRRARESALSRAARRLPRVWAALFLSSGR